jgi:hypothetical protein
MTELDFAKVLKVLEINISIWTEFGKISVRNLDKVNLKNLRVVISYFRKVQANRDF